MRNVCRWSQMPHSFTFTEGEGDGHEAQPGSRKESEEVAPSPGHHAPRVAPALSPGKGHSITRLALNTSTYA